jgi:ketosteroid isomerase-like protein
MNIDVEVLAVSAAWDAALVADDAVAFAGFVTDDWVYVGPSGVTTRAEVIDWIAGGRLSHHTMRTIGPPRIAVHRDTAVVSARKTSSGTWGGDAYTADEWITEVFVRQGGRWRCMLSHKCPVALG